MKKPTETGRPAPKPVDDPLAQLIDKLSDEVEPVAGASDGDTTTSTPDTGIEPSA